MLVTLTTDIGWMYAAQMKGVILSINPNAKIVDITHDIQPHNIREGAFVLYATLPHFPGGIHIGIVDPGVGTTRKGLIIKCNNNHILIGPDNGVLIPIAKKFGIEKIYEIITYTEVSGTFHGRDIFAPIGAHLSLHKEPTEFGILTEKIVDLEFEPCKILREKIVGKIIFIDKFGNLLVNIPGDVILKKVKFFDTIRLQINDKVMKTRFYKSYGFAKSGELLCTISSSNFLEIAQNYANAKNSLNADMGDIVTLFFD